VEEGALQNLHYNAAQLALTVSSRQQEQHQISVSQMTAGKR